MDAPEPDKGNKMKGKTVADPFVAKKPNLHDPQAITRTSASTSRASPRTEDDDDNDDDDEIRLARRMRLSTGALKVPRSEAVESVMDDSVGLVDRRPSMRVSIWPRIPQSGLV